MILISTWPSDLGIFPVWDSGPVEGTGWVRSYAHIRTRCAELPASDTFQLPPSTSPAPDSLLIHGSDASQMSLSLTGWPDSQLARSAGPGEKEEKERAARVPAKPGWPRRSVTLC